MLFNNARRLGIVAITITSLTLTTSTQGQRAVASAHTMSASLCSPASPSSCTLREVASIAGMRVGATLEDFEIANAQYGATLSQHFNALTPENALKMYTVEPGPDQWNFGPADAVVDFAHAHNMSVRGHTLVWSQDSFTPAWVQSISDTAQLRAVMHDYIAAVMQRYAGRIHRYDVVNEPLQTLGTGPSTSVFWNLGPDWIADAFSYAHSIDPSAELWLNETATDWLPAKHDALVALVTNLVRAGIPIHGVGIQTHRVPGLAIDQDVFTAQLLDFTRLGLEVAVTELDVPVSPTDPDAFTAQAVEYQTIVAACLAVLGCTEVTTWGVTDAATWLDTSGPWPKPTRPLLFDTSFQTKPAYASVRDTLAAAAVQELATPHRTVAVAWTAAEAARLREIATHLEVTPSHVQKLAVYLTGWLIAFTPPGQTPATLPPAGNATSYSVTWAPIELPVLDSVAAKFALDDIGATRVSVYLLDFLLGLSGH